MKRLLSIVFAFVTLILVALSCGGCAALYGVDFLVRVDGDRAPVVLHLTDPQIIEESDELKEQKCYRYIRETVQAVKPDLILMTGDLVYGKFDTEGEALVELIAFMESLKTPWAPVFGNHDNESPMGVAWQCERLEEAEYCLFKRGDVQSGNGNYTVGILQGGRLKRVFFMMDSGGCADMSAQSSFPTDSATNSSIGSIKRPRKFARKIGRRSSPSRSISKPMRLLMRTRSTALAISSPTFPSISIDSPKRKRGISDCSFGK